MLKLIFYFNIFASTELDPRQYHNTFAMSGFEILLKYRKCTVATVFSNDLYTVLLCEPTQILH